MSKSYNPKRIREVDFKTDCSHIFIISSSGHCSLDCAYCIVNPIVKHQPTLNYDDLEFLLGKVNGKALLLFSGKGDFFAGYKKQEKLLARLLEQNVEVALDVNGVMIHEFPEISSEKLAKIRYINLTMHYRQLVNNNALNAWKENALTLIGKKGGENFIAGLILTPAERDYWREALTYYEQNVFAETGQHLVLIKDINAQFSEETEEYIRTLEREFPQLVEEVYQEDFSTRFGRYSHVLCPAGNAYFRVWNDGRVQGCPYIPELADCGNLKERKFFPREGTFMCTEAKYCDCNNVALAGKMIFPAQAVASGGDAEKVKTFWAAMAQKIKGWI